MGINWVSFCKDFNLPLALHDKKVTQGWGGLPCPFCGSHSNSLGLNLESGGVSCWKCSKHSPLDTIEALLRIPRREASFIYRKYLTNTSGMVFNKKRTTTGASSVIIPETDLNERELKYLSKRQINDYHISTYDFRSGGFYGDFGARIVMPIYYNGDIVSATSRSILKGVEPKYWTLPPDREVVHHKHILYNWDLVKGKPFLVEGPLDSVKGGPGFVSSFGAILTDEQLLLLSTKDSVGIMFDGDDTGKRQGNAYANYLDSLGVDVELINLHEYKDLGDMPLDEIDGIREELGMERIYE